MIGSFRTIRQRLLSDNRFTRYLLYAIGEIVLVVIGILIALSINNWNEGRKDRAREKKYLISLRADLEIDLENLERRSSWARQRTLSATRILELEAPSDQQALFVLDSLVLRVAIWGGFNQRTNTIEELTSSGNLSSLKSDSIKALLLGLKQRGVFLQTVNQHIREEYDKFIYPPMAEEYEAFAFFNLQKLAENDTIVREKTVEEHRLPELLDQARNLLENKLFRNGLRLAAVNYKALRMNYEPMVSETKRLMTLIDEDLAGEDR